MSQLPNPPEAVIILERTIAAKRQREALARQSPPAGPPTRSNVGGPVIAGAGQRVITPLTEAGIELTPEYSKGQTIEPGISRVWAMLYGRNGNSLVPVSVDPSGRISVTTQPIRDMQLVSAQSGNDIGLASRTVGAGDQFDYVAGVIVGGGCQIMINDGDTNRIMTVPYASSFYHQGVAQSIATFGVYCRGSSITIRDWSNDAYQWIVDFYKFTT